MTKNIFAGFFRLCETSFRNFFKCLHSVPPSIFFYFAEEWIFKNSPRAPLLNFSALCDLPETKKYFEKKIQKEFQEFLFNFFPHAGTVEENTLNFEVLSLFLSLRYGADLGRSRLVFNCISDVIKLN